MDDIREYRNDTNSVFHRCRLGNKYLAIDASISPDSDFESGVVKIQRKDVVRITDCEKARAKTA